MTRKLAVTERQITAICNGAAKAQHPHIPEIKIGNAFIRLIPADMVHQNDTVDGKGKGYL